MVLISFPKTKKPPCFWLNFYIFLKFTSRRSFWCWHLFQFINEILTILSLLIIFKYRALCKKPSIFLHLKHCIYNTHHSNKLYLKNHWLHSKNIISHYFITIHTHILFTVIIMNPCELNALITVIANSFYSSLSKEDFVFLNIFLSELSKTMFSMELFRGICYLEKKNLKNHKSDI